MKYSLSRWIKLSKKNREEIINDIQSILGDEFSFECETLGQIAPLFKSNHTENNFRVIFSHKAKFGFDTDDEKTASFISSPLQMNLDEVRPCLEIELPPFLVMEQPIREDLASQLLNRDTQGDNDHPAFLTREEAEHCARAYRGKLPTEYQWETFCRATSNNLFPWGNSIPSDEIISPWLEFDLDKAASKVNIFGLSGLFFGEWCRDEYRTSHAKDAKTQDGFVIKGGGAYFWPWQDDEWVWCLSAMRMPSTDLIDGMAACRIVIELPGLNLT